MLKAKIRHYSENLLGLEKKDQNAIFPGWQVVVAKKQDLIM